MYNYLFAGLVVRIDAPQWALHENIGHFKIVAGNPDIYCKILFEDFSKDDSLVIDSEVLVSISSTSIYNHDGAIVQINSDKYDIPSCVVALNNYTEWKLYISPEYSSPSCENVIKSIKEGVLAALRDTMIIALSKNRGLLLHSCSILWDGQVIAFSGKSGSGKSTHARLWQEKYGVSILDGDVTACRVLNGSPVAYGLPWCGTSGQFMNQSGDLRAVVFLQQAKTNSIRKLDFKDAYLYLTGRCFLIPWNNELTNSFLDIIDEMVVSTEFYLLECLPDYEAVEMVKECLGLS